MEALTLEKLNESIGTLCFATMATCLGSDTLKNLEDDEGDRPFEFLVNDLEDVVKENMTSNNSEEFIKMLSEALGVEESIIVIKCNGKFYNCMNDGIGLNDNPIDEENLRDIVSFEEYIPEFETILYFDENPRTAGRYFLCSMGEYPEMFNEAFEAYSANACPEGASLLRVYDN